jgi:hypothetical protein
LPTLSKQKAAALEMLGLKEGETLLELGSGDGRVMLAAAARGLKVTGIELNPLLVLVSLYVTRRYRQQVRVIWGTYWASRGLGQTASSLLCCRNICAGWMNASKSGYPRERRSNSPALPFQSRIKNQSTNVTVYTFTNTSSQHKSFATLNPSTGETLATVPVHYAYLMILSNRHYHASV